MDWRDFTSIGALLISTITLILLFKNRKNALRENLYNRQLEIFKSLFDLIVEVEWELEHWVHLTKISKDKISSNIQREHNHKDILKIEDNIVRLTDDLDIKLSKAELFLPDTMSNEFYIFWKAFDKIQDKFFEREIQDSDLIAFNNNCFEIEDSIRQFIGLEKLTRENRRVIDKKFN